METYIINNKTFDKIKVFVFDFDGVLTDNLVHISEDGREHVTCSRSDGLAFDVLRKLNKTVYILSSETNLVVKARAKKLKVPVIQGAENKVDSLKKISKKHKCGFDQMIFIGNDINDYNSIKLCGYSVCPNDSHPKIKEIVSLVLNTCGGKGVIRELLEDVFGLNFIEILFKNREK
jgi:3-deoxy-D-manno-octulosonate 8-phosphate phosphatase (KDO 8-P phosphatase)